MILEAIPYDKQISAGDIAEKTGIRPQTVGIVIGKTLVPVYVERIEMGVRPKMNYEYKRRPNFLDPEKLRN